MFKPFAFRVLLITCLAGILGACAPSSESLTGSMQFDAELQAVGDAVSQAVGYSRADIGVIGNRVRLQISISAPKVAAADPATREQAAAAVVTAAEGAIASHGGLKGVEVISIVVAHPAATGEAPSPWHVEDVVEFRKGQNQRFSMHGPS
ncbi:MAG: hypothetical protein WCH32_12715 [Pseudomonadota bacterium]